MKKNSSVVVDLLLLLLAITVLATPAFSDLVLSKVERRVSLQFDLDLLDSRGSLFDSQSLHLLTCAQHFESDQKDITFLSIPYDISGIGYVIR